MSDPRFLAPISEGQVLAGKYVVGAQLGVGGMGVVHAAHDTELDRRVALKVLLPRLVASPTANERLKQEARAASRITSEHVVKLLDYGKLPDGAPFFVMEYLEGKDLRAVLREEGTLAPQRAVDYLLQALQAVAEGHLHGVIHRDLKPGNLFLAERADGTPLIKVLDFGIAKTLRPAANPDDLGLTSSEDVQLGSPTYMPPEQFQNPRDVDARSDIWSLGVTLYELISGQVPFQGRTYVELVSRVLKEPPDSFKVSRPALSLPEGLEQVVRRCLEKERDHRYSNAVELAVALAPYGSDDARLSLTRVSGLSRRNTPTPRAMSTTTAYEATLPVPVDPGRPHTVTSSGARPVPRPFPRRGVALAAVGTGLLGLAALALTSLGGHKAGPTQLQLAAPSQPVTSSLSALLPVDPVPPSAIARPPSPGDPIRVVPGGPTSLVPASASAVKPGAATSGRSPHVNAAVAKPDASGQASEAKPAGTSEPTVSEPSTTEAARSSKIEDLIKKRR
jgi:serine/threonine-protein kinase